MASLIGGEVLDPAHLPAWRRHVFKPLLIDIMVVPDINRRRRSLKDIGCFSGACNVGYALDTSSTGTYNGDALVSQSLQWGTVSVPASVVIVPATGVEGMSFE